MEDVRIVADETPMAELHNDLLFLKGNLNYIRGVVVDQLELTSWEQPESAPLAWELRYRIIRSY